MAIDFDKEFNTYSLRFIGENKGSVSFGPSFKTSEKRFARFFNARTVGLILTDPR